MDGVRTMRHPLRRTTRLKWPMKAVLDNEELLRATFIGTSSFRNSLAGADSVAPAMVRFSSLGTACKECLRLTWRAAVGHRELDILTQATVTLKKDTLGVGNCEYNGFVFEFWDVGNVETPM